MVLRLTNDEVDLMRNALLDLVRTLRSEESVHCGGASCAAIELCRKRLRLETLLEALEEQRIAMNRSTLPGRVETMPLRREVAPEQWPELVA